MRFPFFTAIICFTIFSSSPATASVLRVGSEKVDSVLCRTLCVNMTDGQVVEFLLDEHSRINSLGAFFEILVEGDTLYLKSDQVKHFSYGKKWIPTGINRPEKEDFGILPFTLTDDGSLVFPQLHEGSIVNIYDLNGQVVLSHRAARTAPANLSLVQLPSGVYIIVIDHQTFKIRK